MTATITEARDAILGRFRTVWLADPLTSGVPVQYQDVRPAGYSRWPPEGLDSSKNPIPWARVTMQHNPEVGGQVTLRGDEGTQRYRRYGVVTVSLFDAVGKGLSGLDSYGAVAKSAFEGVRLSPTGVVFRSVRFFEVGESGAWYQANVTAEFEYDEVR